MPKIWISEPVNILQLLQNQSMIRRAYQGSLNSFFH